MKEALVLFGQSLGKRQTDKEKIRFINTVAKPLLADNIKVQIHRNPIKRVKSNNLMIGDLENAQYIFLTPYDTGKRMLVPHTVYRPLDDHYNQTKEKNNLLIYSGLGILGVAGLFLTYSLFNMSFELRIIALLLDIMFILLIAFSIMSPSAPANMNRNSAACAITAVLAKTHRNNAAFIFTDQSIESHLGIIQVRNWYQSDADKKTFVILDSLSDGEQLFVVCRKKDTFAARLANEINADIITLSESQIDNSVLSQFKHCMMIVSGSQIDGHLSVSHSRTNEDYHINTKQVEELEEHLNQFVEQL
ncbi:MAG: hypothetical protein LKF79_01630 [Solobacterium sp.]|jgi:hypothetical protein|nr:hypothetical protein [Solobacterium sp.]MCH4265328.1 hypothetical protein [Solobacterium sp.]